MISKEWRLTAAVVGIAMVLGLLSACGQETSATHNDIEKTAIASPGHSGSSSAGSSGQSADATLPASDPADSALTAPDSQMIPPSSSSSGSSGAASTVSPDQPTTSAASSNQSIPPSSSSSQSGPGPAGSPDQPSTSSSPSGNSGPASTVPADRSPVSTPSSPPSPSSSGSPAQSQAPAAVTFSVIGNAEWGMVIEPASIAFKSGETVGDLLIRTLKSHKLAYETRGAGALFYVTGIDGLFEFDDGPTSGWKYRVNGKIIGTSSGVYKLETGDRVEWFYTTGDEEADSGGGKP